MKTIPHYNLKMKVFTFQFLVSAFFFDIMFYAVGDFTW
jgi:hypothetical protein